MGAAPPIRKDVTVKSVTAEAVFTMASPSMLFNPDEPHVGPNELLAQLGSMRDPRNVDHNCPFCFRSMRWELFKEHMLDSDDGRPGCFRRWFNTVDVRFRRFAGATPGGDDE